MCGAPHYFRIIFCELNCNFNSCCFTTDSSPNLFSSIFNNHFHQFPCFKCRINFSITSHTVLRLTAKTALPKLSLARGSPVTKWNEALSSNQKAHGSKLTGNNERFDLWHGNKAVGDGIASVHNSKMGGSYLLYNTFNNFAPPSLLPAILA